MKTWQKYALWYSVLTLVFLYPLILHFRSLAGHGDAWQFVWNIWWVNKVITTSHLSFFYTNVLHWPSGISLILQTMTLTNTLPAVLLSHVIGLIASYNVLVILHFIFSGIGMYLLCYHFSKNHLASFIGGFLFAFSPYHIVHFYGHLHLLTTEVLPFAILFLVRTLEGKRWSWIGAAIFCILTAYTDLYYFLFLFIVCVALVLWYRVFTWRVFLVPAITLIFVVPYLGPLIHASQLPDFQVLGHNSLQNSNDAKSFFIPGGRSAFRSLTSWYWNHWPAWRETGSYVGYSVIILLLIGLWKHRSKPFFFWMIVGIIFAILSLGPHLQIGGRVITSFMLPYGWIERHVAFIRLAGVPARFFVMTSLSLAILVSMTLAKQRKWVMILFFVVLAFEYFPAPVEVSAVTPSPFYATLRANHEQFAILDISDAPAKVLYYQTIHEHPLIGGYTTRPTVSTDRFLATTNFKDKKILQSLQVRYVLVPPGTEYTKGLREVYTDDVLTAYRVY